VIYLALDQLRERKKKRPSRAVSLQPIDWPQIFGSSAG
jgi:hypothetical protein